MTSWIPPDISSLCGQTQANFTQCSIGLVYVNLLVQLFGETNNQTLNSYQDYFSYERDDEVIAGDDDDYDFIIVGGGTAGCVLANRLSEVTHWKILLLEAGPDEPEVTSVPGLLTPLWSSSLSWQYTTQPDGRSCLSKLGQSCACIRGKGMGGSSAINDMLYVRGNRQDYDDWAAMGNTGWSYEEVLQYFKKSENNRDAEVVDTIHHSRGGPQTIERFRYVDQNQVIMMNALDEIGIHATDVNGRNQMGSAILQHTTKDGQRMSANQAFVKPISKRKNLKIITEAEATEVLIRDKMAYGVSYYKNNTYYKVYASKEVIVSTGSINTPKLLMLSGIGRKEDLEASNITQVKDLNVGYNLQDHINCEGFAIQLNKTSTLVSNDEMLKQIQYYHETRDSDSPLASTGVIPVTAFLSISNGSVPDIQYFFTAVNIKEYFADPLIWTVTAILPSSFYDGIFVRPAILHPKSRGHIKLNSTDPVFAAPLIYSGYLEKEEDIKIGVEGLKFIMALEDTKAFIDNGYSIVRERLPGCMNYTWGTDEYFACLYKQYTETTMHAVGTCKMGPESDPDAVVDPELKVYGLRSLRVVDGSVLPTIVSGNTNAPIMMIAEKAADFIKSYWLEADDSC